MSNMSIFNIKKAPVGTVRPCVAATSRDKCGRFCSRRSRTRFSRVFLFVFPHVFRLSNRFVSLIDALMAFQVAALNQFGKHRSPHIKIWRFHYHGSSPPVLSQFNPAVIPDVLAPITDSFSSCPPPSTSISRRGRYPRSAFVALL